MIISRACEHAIRAVLLVATQPDGGPVGIAAAARALDLPSPTLAKVVQVLTRHGILASVRGPGGGITLAKPAESITVLDIVSLIDGAERFRSCLLGLPGCSEAGPHCPLHDAWGPARDRVREVLARANVAKLAERLRRERHVLARGRAGRRGGTRVPNTAPGTRGRNHRRPHA